MPLLLSICLSLYLSSTVHGCVEILRMALQIQSTLCINYSQQESWVLCGGGGKGHGKVEKVKSQLKKDAS